MTKFKRFTVQMLAIFMAVAVLVAVPIVAETDYDLQTTCIQPFGFPFSPDDYE